MTPISTRPELGKIDSTIQNQNATGHPRVLIVDDDDDTRDVLRAYLQGTFEIVETGVAEEAIALALGTKPDAVLLDLLMPGFSGLEICQTLASLSFTQHIPILIVSGEPAAKYQNLCENLGAAGYFEKPLHIEQLKSRLSAIVTSKRPERRKEPRARLHVVLKLTGTDRIGMEFELLTTTENVSASGFSCGCTVELEKGAVVEVYLQNEDAHYVGAARAAWSEWRTTGCPRYGFGFVEKPTRWILG